jgi:hypothetical protein
MVLIAAPTSTSTSTATVAASTAATSPTTTASSASASAPLGVVRCIDPDGAPLHCDGACLESLLGCRVIKERDEAEAARLSCLSIGDDTGLFDRSELFHRRLEFGVPHAPREISTEDFLAHRVAAVPSGSNARAVSYTPDFREKAGSWAVWFRSLQTKALEILHSDPCPKGLG